MPTKTLNNGKLIRIVKDGVPTYVAPWYKELTKEGQRMIGQNRIYSKSYGKRICFK